MSLEQNITQSKRLIDSEKNIRKWVENSPTCTKIVDLDFKLQYMSRAGIDAIGIEDINVYYDKACPLEIYPQPYRDEWEACYNRTKRTGLISKADVIAITLEGEELWYDSTFIPISDDKGNLDYIDITERKLSDDALKKLNAELEERVKQRTAALKEANAQLIKLSETDTLTKIANRRAYERKIIEYIHMAKRTLKPLSLLMIDIDDFKIYNDTYGHDSGDIILEKVAATILTSSPRKTDFVARFGGEEFIVLLPATDTKSALFVAENIRNSIELLEITLPGKSIVDNVTVSLGVATLEGSELNEVTLLKHADISLYTAKNAGKNCIKVFESK
jgi:diguanylate cyclase (GGDEF)-like protein